MPVDLKRSLYVLAAVLRLTELLLPLIYDMVVHTVQSAIEKNFGERSKHLFISVGDNPYMRSMAITFILLFSRYS